MWLTQLVVVKMVQIAVRIALMITDQFFLVCSVIAHTSLLAIIIALVLLNRRLENVVKHVNLSLKVVTIESLGSYLAFGVAGVEQLEVDSETLQVLGHIPILLSESTRGLRTVPEVAELVELNLVAVSQLVSHHVSKLYENRHNICLLYGNICLYAMSKCSGVNGVRLNSATIPKVVRVSSLVLKHVK